jgi:hypothetical protein
MANVMAFLPQLKASNEALVERIANGDSEVDIEAVRPDEAYISMNLDLGVLEEGKETEEEGVARRTEELLGGGAAGAHAGITSFEGGGDEEGEGDIDDDDDDDDVQFEEDSEVEDEVSVGHD